MLERLARSCEGSIRVSILCLQLKFCSVFCFCRGAQSAFFVKTDSYNRVVRCLPRMCVFFLLEVDPILRVKLSTDYKSLFLSSLSLLLDALLQHSLIVQEGCFTLLDLEVPCFVGPCCSIFSSFQRDLVTGRRARHVERAFLSSKHHFRKLCPRSDLRPLTDNTNLRHRRRTHR
jgi:hypothetical protein